MPFREAAGGSVFLLGMREGVEEHVPGSIDARREAIRARDDSNVAHRSLVCILFVFKAVRAEVCAPYESDSVDDDISKAWGCES